MQLNIFVVLAVVSAVMALPQKSTLCTIGEARDCLEKVQMNSFLKEVS